MRELVLATVLAEIKNTFKDDIDDPNLIELLYGAVTEPLGLPRVTVSKGTASLIINRQPRVNHIRLSETILRTTE